jgi:polar amino acid transport system substrate-binding protein
MSPFRCLLVLSWVSAWLFSAAVKAETLRFATIDYCPFTCDPSVADGKEGFMTDVLREAFEETGYTLEIDMLPYVRAVKSVRSGMHDGIVLVGREFAPDLIYPDQPTVIQRVAFLVNAGDSWRYTGVESLSEVTVGIVQGFYYVDPDLIAYLEAQQGNDTRVFVMHGANTTRRGLGMLQARRITTFLEGEYSAIYEMGTMGIQDAVKVAGYTTDAFEDYTAFSPSHPNARQYAQVLSGKIAQLKQSGRLNEILRRYGITSYQQP